MVELKWKESGVDVINLILAAILVLTPWIFGFASDSAAAPNAWVSGIAIGVVAIAALTKFTEWEEWINLVLGLWVLVSPWVLAFAAQTTARWAHVVVGLIVAVLAGFKLWLEHQTPPRVSAR
ncbi:SPW repeat protein [Bradyrhizobium sp. RDT10]